MVLPEPKRCGGTRAAWLSTASKRARRAPRAPRAPKRPKSWSTCVQVLQDPGGFCSARTQVLQDPVWVLECLCTGTPGPRGFWSARVQVLQDPGGSATPVHRCSRILGSSQQVFQDQRRSHRNRVKIRRFLTNFPGLEEEHQEEEEEDEEQEEDEEPEEQEE